MIALKRPLFVIFFISLITNVYSDELRTELIAHFRTMEENASSDWISQKWTEAYVKVRDDERNIQPALLEIVEGDNATYGTYALMLLKERGEVNLAAVKSSMNFADRRFDEAKKNDSSYEGDRFVSRMNLAFDVIATAPPSGFPEKYFHKYALSNDTRIAASAFKRLSEHGSGNSIPVLREALDKLKDEDLRLRLNKRYLQPLEEKYPQVSFLADDQKTDAELVHSIEDSSLQADKKQNLIIWIILSAIVISMFGVYAFKRRA